MANRILEASKQSEGKYEQSQILAKLLVDHGAEKGSMISLSLAAKANLPPLSNKNTTTILGMPELRSKFAYPGSSRSPVDPDYHM